MSIFWTVVVVLLILWALGFSFGIVGWFIHILLIAAVIAILIKLINSLLNK